MDLAVAWLEAYVELFQTFSGGALLECNTYEAHQQHSGNEVLFGNHLMILAKDVLGYKSFFMVVPVVIVPVAIIMIVCYCRHNLLILVFFFQFF